MSLEQNISSIINEELKGDIVERVIREQLEKCICNAVNELFSNWGSCKKIVEKKIEEVMIPQLEKYDYSKHIVKLDETLTAILKETTVDNSKILNNFKSFLTQEPVKEINLSDIFTKYCDVVAEHVSTEGLGINYDDGVSYESVEVKMDVDISSREYSKYENISVYFSCEHDESLNFQMSLFGDKGSGKYYIINDEPLNIKALRYMDPFKIFIMTLKQQLTDVVLDTEYEVEDITPTEEPEPTYL